MGNVFVLRQMQIEKMWLLSKQIPDTPLYGIITTYRVRHKYL